MDLYPFLTKDNGNLYCNSFAMSIYGYSPFVFGYELYIKEISENIINFEIVFDIPAENYDYDDSALIIEPIPSTAVLTPDGWRLTEMLY
jgi:hypothetical protein